MNNKDSVVIHNQTAAGGYDLDTGTREDEPLTDGAVIVRTDAKIGIQTCSGVFFRFN